MENPTQPPPRLDMYAQDLLRQSYQANPISSDVLNQYGQGMSQQAIQPPVINNYAPQQQFQQAPMPQQPQRTLQPSEKRMEYNALVEQRFNEIADMVGGMEVLYKTGRIDKAKKAALEDIQNIYGEAPAIEQAPQVIEMDGNKIAVGGPLRTGMLLPTDTEKRSKELEVKRQEADLTKAEKETKAAEFDRIEKLRSGKDQFDYGIQVIDQIINHPNLQSGIGWKAFSSMIPETDAKAIAGLINQSKGQNFLNAYSSLRGAAGISNIEGQKAEQAMSRVDQYLKESDLKSALMELRNRYEYAKQKADAGLQFFGQPETETQAQGMPQAQPTGQTAQPVQKGFTRQVWNGNELK